MCDGREPVADDEILYRRIPVVWYDSVTGIEEDAFQAHKINDKDGLSLSRAKYKTKAEAAAGLPGKQYYVAEVTASQVRALGISVNATPKPDDPGHVSLPELNSENRKETRTIELGLALKKVAKNVEGPF